MMTKRVVALVLAFAMTFSFAGFLAFADGGNPIEEFFEGDSGDYDFATNASFPAIDEEGSPITVFADGGNPIEVFIEGDADSYDFTTISDALAAIDASMTSLTENSWADIQIIDDYTFSENITLPWFVNLGVQENINITTDGFTLSGSNGERSSEVRLEKGVTLDGFKEYNNYYWDGSWTQAQYSWEFRESGAGQWNLELIFNGEYSAEPTVDLSVGKSVEFESFDEEGSVSVSLTSLDLASDYTVEFTPNTYLRYVIPVDGYSGGNVFRLQFGTDAPIYIAADIYIADNRYGAWTWDQPVALLEYEAGVNDMVAAFKNGNGVNEPLHSALDAAMTAGNGQIRIFGDYEIGRDSYLVVPNGVSIEALGNLTFSNGNTLMVESGGSVIGFGDFYTYSGEHTTEPKAGIVYEWYFNDSVLGTRWYETPTRAYINPDDAEELILTIKNPVKSGFTDLASMQAALDAEFAANPDWFVKIVGRALTLKEVRFLDMHTMGMKFSPDSNSAIANVANLGILDEIMGFFRMSIFYEGVSDEHRKQIAISYRASNKPGQAPFNWIIERNLGILNFNDAEWIGYEWAMDAVKELHAEDRLGSDGNNGKFYPEQIMDRGSLAMMMYSFFQPHRANIKAGVPADIEFPDFADDNWKEITVAVQDYFVHADGSGNTLDLRKDVTRADLAFCVAKMLKFPFDVTVTTSYSDISSLHTDHQKAITICETTGFMKGYGDGRFHPEDEVTKADAIVILKRAMDYLGGVKSLYYYMMRPGYWYFTSLLTCYESGLFTNSAPGDIVAIQWGNGVWDGSIDAQVMEVTENIYNAILDNGNNKNLFKSPSSLKSFAALKGEMLAKYDITILTLACVAEYLAPLLKDIGSGQVFTDVPPDSSYYDGVMFVVSHHLILGDGAGKFNPNDDITEGEVYKALDTVLGITTNSAKYTSSSKIKLQVAAKLVADALFGSVVGGANTSILKSFNNANAIDPENKQAMAYFIYAGILEGITHGNDKANLQPNKNLTRADFSVFLARAVAGIDTSKMKDYERNVTGGVQ